MHELLADYPSTIYALGALASLMFVQLLVADFAGLKAGHTPGSSVTADHDNFLFRAARTVANINESIAIFLLAVPIYFATTSTSSCSAPSLLL